MVKHYYFYCVDEDFGAFFIKFCSYFPYTGKLCINGHECLKGQLARRGIEFEALDNGLLRCADPAAAQRIAEAFDEKKIERFPQVALSIAAPLSSEQDSFNPKKRVVIANRLCEAHGACPGSFHPSVVNANH